MKKLIRLSFLLFFIVINSAFAIETRILFLGDSLTEGYGISKENAYPNLIEKTLHSEGRKEIKIINAGESGSKTSSAIRRLRWHMRSKPSILVLALGANDGLRGIKAEVIKNNLQSVIDLAKKNEIKVLLVGMQMPINYGKEYRGEFYDIYLELAKKNELTFLPFLLEGVARVKELNLDDGIHPNEKGHEQIAKTVLPFLKKLL